MRPTALCGLLLLCSLLFSCATLQTQEGIDVALINVRLTEATVWETTALFTVRISNETPEPLALDGSVHKFYLEGHYIGEGMSSERVEVPRLNSTTQEITVHLRNVAMATRIRPILEARSLDYRVSSTLYVVKGKGSSKCRLSHEGHLALEDFQPNLQGGAKRE